MRGNAGWLDQIEERAYLRLRELRSRKLWDGNPPIPVDFVVEHLLDLRISWEDVREEDSEMILACLRPETRELVLNERHRNRFVSYPGVERFSKAHEAGHADVMGLSAEADQISLMVALYVPQRRSATKGDVAVIHPRLRDLSPTARTEVFEALASLQRNRSASGEDSPLVRRAVDHYAAVLLMPRELVKKRATGRDLGTWGAIVDLAREFVVSTTAMRIRLEELSLIFGVGEGGRLLRSDPSQEQQASLF